MKINKELLKGSTALLILSIISAEDMYGYKIVKELEIRSDNTFSMKEGTLYPLLHSLEEGRFVDYDINLLSYCFSTGTKN